MGTATIEITGNQADLIRRSLAADAEMTANAIPSHLGSLVDGHFRDSEAKHNRESLDYCVTQLRDQIHVLKQVPWSSEAEVERGLTTKAEASRILAVLGTKAEVA